MDKYLDFNSNHPKSAKHAVVRALSDRAKKVSSSLGTTTEEMDHVGKVPWYNYLKWMDDRPTQWIIEQPSSWKAH